MNMSSSSSLGKYSCTPLHNAMPCQRDAQVRKINKRAQRFAPLRSAARSAARSACALDRGAGYRSQWPRYATGDLGPMRGKLFVSLQASC